MTHRAHYLRGWSANPQTIPMIYSDELASPSEWWMSSTAPGALSGCSLCRDSQLHCPTPAACMLSGRPDAEDKPLPLFCDSPTASKAIGWALFAAVVTVLFAVAFR